MLYIPITRYEDTIRYPLKEIPNVEAYREYMKVVRAPIIGMYP